jgi:hypothetical protein
VSRAMRNWTDGFYWIGTAMALACFALVVAGNTDLLWRFEHRVFPLSWAIGAGSVLAFLAFEFCPSASSRSSDAEDRIWQPYTDWEVAESVEGVESLES